MIFSIGPVQSFIEKARKAQDLYAGSFLLSYLSSLAWGEIKAHGLAPLYPVRKSRALPNVMLFQGEMGRAEEAARRAEEAVRERWEKLLPRLLPVLTPSSREQTLDFPEVYWVWGKNVGEAQRFLAASKKARPFSQSEEDHRSLKCSICGEREALFYRKDHRGKTPGILQRNPWARIYSYYDRSLPLRDLSPGEALCALCFSKRRLREGGIDGFEGEFPSTARIALMDAEASHREPFREFRKLFKGHFDYHLYYPENLTEEYLKREGILGEAKPHQLIRRHGELFEGVFLPKYYAVFLADGDDMGKRIASLSPQQLPGFSSSLLDFAEKVGEILKEPRGRIIYAGGDDLLAMVNLNGALPLLSRIREAFPSGLTLSASLTVAHYKQPLSQVLAVARGALKNWAKKVKGKNALAIVVIRHSGERTLSLLQWKQLGKAEEILKALLDGEVSTNFIYSLKKIGEQAPLADKPFLDLAKTYIKRSMGEGGDFHKVYSAFEDLFLGMKGLEKRGGPGEIFDKNANFLSLLDNLAFLRRELKEGR